MNVKCLGIVLLVTLTHAGCAILGKGLVLEWEFLSDTEVTFELSIPNEITENHDWVGVGLKFQSEGDGMENSDIVFITIGSITNDAWAISDGRPHSDIELGGNEDVIENLLVIENNEGVMYSWTRQLNTGDDYDKELIEGELYYVLWAFGVQNQEGNQIQHLTGNRGKVPIVLDDSNLCEEESSSFLSFMN